MITVRNLAFPSSSTICVVQEGIDKKSPIFFFAILQSSESLKAPATVEGCAVIRTENYVWKESNDGVQWLPHADYWNDYFPLLSAISSFP